MCRLLDLDNYICDEFESTSIFEYDIDNIIDNGYFTYYTLNYEITIYFKLISKSDESEFNTIIKIIDVDVEEV